MSFPNAITSQSYPAMYLNPYINSIRANDARYDTSLKIPVYPNSGDQATPLVGDILYASGSGKFNYYNGTAWVPVTTSSDLTVYVLKAGDTMTGALIMNNDAGEKIVLRDGATALHGYLSYRDSANSLKGYIGYGTPSNTTFTIQNTLGNNQYACEASSNHQIYRGGTIQVTIDTDVKALNSYVTGTSGGGGYLFGTTATNHGIYRVPATNNIIMATTSGTLQLQTATSGDINLVPAGSGKTSLYGNTGGWEAFKVNSTASTVAGTNINYAGILSAFNGGRMILPTSTTLPAGPQTAEIYGFDAGAGDIQPRYYNGFTSSWMTFITNGNSPKWCSLYVTSTGVLGSQPLNNDFTVTSNPIAHVIGSGGYSVEFTQSVYVLTATTATANAIITCTPFGAVPTTQWSVTIAVSGVATDSDFSMHARG